MESSGTPKKKIEQELDFRLLVDSIKDYGIFMLDPSGKILTWNIGAENLKGYTAQEVIGSHFSSFYTKSDRERGHPERELNIAAQTGRYEEEGWRVRKDGSVFWANVIITAVRDPEGQLRGFGKVTRDLTERMKANQAMKESEEKFRLMVEGVQDYAILMLDEKGFIASWNAGAERIKGWTPKEIIGRHFSTFYPAEDVKLGKPEFELEAATREGRFEDYGWRVRKDGTTFWANVIITALHDEKGKLRGFSKVTRDITDRKNAEEKLKRAYENLEARIEDRTKALQSANRELESFNYSVSHDLRAPLRSMDGFSQALITNYSDKFDDRGKDYLRRIRESAKRMGQLIEDILNLSKIARVEVNKSEVDLSQTAEKVVAELKTADPNREVRFDIEENITAYCDENLIRLVLENLLGNSWKYTSKDKSAHIQFGKTGGDGEAVYIVRDDGIGFDMSFVDKLFEPFQRLHTEQEFPGTGIGLATVRRIIFRHGGDVWAKGEVGKGTTIFFTLENKDISK